MSHAEAVYYNDVDERACAWLQVLMDDGLIPKGDIDNRSIADVRADELSGYTQCHLFAGIGGWAVALWLAGWPPSRPVWTASCPCQPFSVAGKGRGEADERHLWPHVRRLAKKRGAPVMFGEQVASPAGRAWLARVQADLEALGYAVGRADVCAAGIGAPHIRQRLWWVADSGRGHAQRRGELGVIQCEAGAVEAEGNQRERGRDAAGRSGATSGGVGNGKQQGLEGYAGDGHNGGEPGWEPAGTARPVAPAGAPSWNGPCIWHPCSDGKVRRIPAEPSLFPMAARVPQRVGLLRGAGNAIVPQLGAEFITAYMECAHG